MMASPKLNPRRRHRALLERYLRGMSVVMVLRIGVILNKTWGPGIFLPFVLGIYSHMNPVYVGVYAY